MRENIFFIAFVAVAAFCVLSYMFLDIPIALIFRDNGSLNIVFEVISFFGRSLLYLPLFLAAFLTFRYYIKSQKGYAISSFLLLSLGVTEIVVDILKFIFGRARPELYFSDKIYGINFIGLYHPYFSLPSGHAATAFCLATCASFLKPQFTPFLYSGAFLIAFSRVAMAEHYLSDVVVGSFIGTAVSFWAMATLRNKGVKI